MSALSKLFDEKKVFVLCGAGGVGKTSVSAAVGILAANCGKRVLVLTIDPSKRLAQTLGIDPEREIEKVIPEALWKMEGLGGKIGSLSGMLLNPQKTFDEVIRRFSKTRESAEDILRHPIYAHLSNLLSGSQEYMAMEKLLSLVESGSPYDLIILDTPPSPHALDFLNAPQKMVRAVSDSALKFFLKPGLFVSRSGFSILKKAPKLFFSFLDKMAGLSFLEEVSELLILAQGLLAGFADRAKAVEALLSSEETAFFAVSTLNVNAAFELETFKNSIHRHGIVLSGVFLNRVIPSFTWGLTKTTEAEFSPFEVAAGKMAFEGYRALHQREAKEEAALENALLDESGNSLPIWKIPLFSEEVHDVETLMIMARQLKGG